MRVAGVAFITGTGRITHTRRLGESRESQPQRASLGGGTHLTCARGSDDALEKASGSSSLPACFAGRTNGTVVPRAGGDVSVCAIMGALQRRSKG